MPLQDEARWRALTDARPAWRTSQSLSLTAPVRIFDPFEPTWPCPDLQMVPWNLTRSGSIQWHTWMCGLRTLKMANTQAEGCLIYSFGARGGDYSWECEMSEWLPLCELHIFDPTLANSGSASASMRRRWGDRFHEIGLAATRHSRANGGMGGTIGSTSTSRLGLGAQVDGAGRPMLPLVEIMASLGHTGRRIHYLKVDIDGEEWR